MTLHDKLKVDAYAYITLMMLLTMTTTTIMMRQIFYKLRRRFKKNVTSVFCTVCLIFRILAFCWTEG